MAAAGWLAAPSAAHAQTAEGPSKDLSEQLDKVGDARKEAEKKKSRDVLIVPIPHSSPSLGSGLTLMAGVFYNPNKSPEPWLTGIGAMYTSNKSWAIGVAHKMALANDRFRIVGFGGIANVNVNFYGIGPGAGDRDLAIKLNEKGFAGVVQGQMRLADHIYLGPRFEYLSLTTSIKREKPLFPDAEIPRAQFKSHLSALGPVANYDRRNSSMNPTDGELVAAAVMFNLRELGSDFSYQKYTLNGNIYRSIGKSTVVAGRVSICSVSKGGPFFDLCMYGSSSDLRGYEAGRFRNRAYWASQVELRQHLFGRFGAVVFAGVGESADSIGQFGKGKWLPAAGAGLRYRPSKGTPINMRLDYSVGKDSHALYLSIGEAF
jgi:outer membrane protein assembly factor BamA